MRQGIIYKYTCKTTGKSYIGQTVSPKNRHRDHFRSVKNGATTTFAEAIAEYGWVNFEYCVLWRGDEDQLDLKECEFIDKFDTFANGYNYVNGNRKVKSIKTPVSNLKITFATHRETCEFHKTLKEAKSILAGKYKTPAHMHNILKRFTQPMF